MTTFTSCADRNASPVYCASCKSTPSATASHYPSRRGLPTSTPFRQSGSPTIPAIGKSSERSRASFAGTPWQWWWRPTESRTASAATSPPTRPRPRCMRWGSTTSFEDPITRTAPTSCTSRGTPRLGCMRARTSRVGCPPRGFTTSGASWRTAAVCRRIRTPGSCPTSGSFPPFPWASGPLCRSIKPGLCSIWPTAACAQTPVAACGLFWATGSSTHRRPAGRSRWRLASVSTT